MLAVQRKTNGKDTGEAERRRGATDKPAEGQLVSNLRYTHRAQALFDGKEAVFLTEKEGEGTVNFD